MMLDLEIATSTRTLRRHAGRWLHRLLTQLVQQSSRDIHKVPKWEEQAVHSLRKRMKKLQAMLQLARPVMSEPTLEAVRRDVRNLKNILSNNRDTLVMTKLARKLGAAISEPPAETDSTSDKLQKAIKLAEKLLIDIGLLDLSQLTWEMIGKTYARSYKSSRKAWEKTQGNPSADNLHEWRKKVKRLYYQSTALEPWFHHPKRLRRTRKLGSLLGDCHDLDVFRDSAKAGKLQPTRGWEGQVTTKRNALLSRIEERADKVFSRAPHKIRDESLHALPQLSPAPS
jgi:CHAD domain-containing protein